MHVRSRRRISLVAAALCVVALTSCARTDDTTPRTRVKPEFTTSENDAKPVKREVCSLMTAEERKALAGQSMNAVLPVNAATGTKECQWVHSLKEPSTQTIRLVAFNTKDWVKLAAPQIEAAMRNPRLSANMVLRLQATAKKLAEGTKDLTDEQICDVYWTLARSNGFAKGSQVVFSSMIGRMRAAFTTGCGDGVLTLLGYGEIGLHTSMTLYSALIDLRTTIQQRASEQFGDQATEGSTAKPSGKPTVRPTAKPTRSAGSSSSSRE